VAITRAIDASASASRSESSAGVRRAAASRHVEMVGGLVEDQQVRAAEHQDGESEARAFTARQRADAALNLVAGKLEGAEVTLDRTALPERPQRRDRFEKGLVERELRKILPIVARIDAATELELTRRNGVFLEEHANERRLPRSVRADEPHDVAAHEGAGEVLDEGAVTDVDPDVFRGDYAITAAIARLEGRGHDRLAADGRVEARHSIEPLAPALRLLAVLSGEVPRDVVLLLRDHLLLLLERSQLGQAAKVSLLDEGLVIPGVGEGGQAFDVEHVIDHSGQKCSIVTDEDDRALQVAQVLLEPARRVEVEVIRRFVEEQDGRRGDELAGERQAATLTAAESRDGRNARFLRIEPQAIEDGIDARSDGVPTLRLESLEVPAIALEVGLARRFTHAIRLLRDRSLECKQVGERASRGLPHGGRLAEIPVLLEDRHRDGVGARNHAARRRHLAGDQAKQRRLARAIPSDDAPTVAGGHGERHILEQRRRAELDRYVVDGKNRHPPALFSAGVASQPFHSSSAAPIVSLLPFRTSGIRSKRGSSASRVSQWSGEYMA
jgi:hypothetical protein